MSYRQQRGRRHRARETKHPSVHSFAAPVAHISILELAPDEFVLELPSEPHLYQVWTDASYHDSSRIGGAAVVTGNSTGAAAVESILTFDLSHMSLSSNNDAEIMTAVMTLQALPEGRIKKLITDSTSLTALFNAVRNTALPPDHSKNYQKLYHFLQRSLAKHPDTVIEWAPRNTGYLHMADSFAYVAPRSNANITAYKYLPEASPHLVEMERKIVIWPPNPPRLVR